MSHVGRMLVITVDFQDRQVDYERLWYLMTQERDLLSSLPCHLHTDYGNIDCDLV